MSLSPIARTHLMIIGSIVIPMAASAGFDALPHEVRARDTVSPRTFTWERTLKVEQDGGFERHAWVFSQGVKNTTRILANPSALKTNATESWEEAGRPRFEADMKKYSAAVAELRTNAESWQAYADRDGVYVLDVAPEYSTCRKTHEDVRDLTAVDQRWKADSSLSFILANRHLNLVENTFDKGEQLTDLDRNMVIGGGPRSERNVRDTIQMSLLWTGLLSDHWDAWGSISSQRSGGAHALESVTIKAGSLISPAIKWTFQFDETEAARLTEARCEIQGTLVEKYTYAGWEDFAGTEYPTSVTCQKFDSQTGALESTETRTLISVDALDPHAIWD
jgi:hypothetical protein